MKVSILQKRYNIKNGGDKIEYINDYDKEYPYSFFGVDNPPKKLYVRGNISLLKEIAISIVGSRNCSKYGEKMARKFARELSELEIITVSGLAKGVDTFVHEETLLNHGKTIAVLPCGLDKIFPEENKELANRIVKNGGLLISEYENNDIADSNKFIQRNRLVSALGECLIVAEASYRSGTSITARLSREQSKTVFCVPSGLDNRCGVGTNTMIKKGAVLLSGIADIFEESTSAKLQSFKAKYIEKRSGKYIKKIEVPKDCQKIYNAISGNATSIDYIYSKTKETIGDISYKLTILELEGCIEAIPGGFYKKIITMEE